MGADVGQLEKQFQDEIKAAKSGDEILRLKAAYLGKKGHLSLFLRELGSVPPESRPLYGSQANILKQKIEEECRALLERLSQGDREKRLQGESMDITLPGRSLVQGGVHPITQMMSEVEDIFTEIGFSIFEGPEIESDYYNFEALNIPENHPARDMQDTFYIGDNLLRTHTSPVQIHVMEKMKPPIRMIAPGVVYRRDSDISHTPMFHQVEGLVVDRSIRFSDLKGILTHVVKRLFGPSMRVRFRPSYFPFTEPSAEVDMGCVICQGKKRLFSGEPVSGESASGGCRLCKETGWLEVMGCGMVNPAVFEKVGYPTTGAKKVSGFDFGMGIERLTMLKLGIPDIRLFFENDIRFLRQF
ncbi:MAG: phenylalanine--tRNA ligase subunit alpha [Deltaproteobacteria bacterium]|nr:phenylalanine--tRNA ligase subunit alpha [Deltaproteobacteria bacterium]